MSFLILLILSIVQGATEFLPVSSSGHLVLLYRIFGVEGNLIFLSVLLHLATLCSVVFVYRKDILKLIKKPFNNLTLCLVISTLVTLPIVFFLLKPIENSFSGGTLMWGFLITAIVLIVSETLTKSSKGDKQVSGGGDNISIEENSVTKKQAVAMGVAQGLAGFPGISRSGATISTGLMTGVKKEFVANYSFLMSIPIIIASMLYELYKYFNTQAPLGFSTVELIASFIITFIIGVLCIKVMLKFIKKQKLYFFSFYLVALVLFIIINDNLLFWF